MDEGTRGAFLDRLTEAIESATARPADHADIIVRGDEPRRPAWAIRSR